MPHQGTWAHGRSYACGLGYPRSIGRDISIPAGYLYVGFRQDTIYQLLCLPISMESKRDSWLLLTAVTVCRPRESALQISPAKALLAKALFLDRYIRWKLHNLIFARYELRVSLPWTGASRQVRTSEEPGDVNALSCTSIELISSAISR